MRINTVNVYSDHHHLVRHIRELVNALTDETALFRQRAIERPNDSELDRAVARSTEYLRPAARSLLLAIVALREPQVETIDSELD